MAGIPVEEIDGLLVDERLVLGALDCPVRYEVWREYAARGPQARLPLLFERAHDDTAPDVFQTAGNIERRLRELRSRPDARPPFPPSVRVSGVDQRPHEPQPDLRDAEVSPFGDWIHAELDLAEMTLGVLPLTSWAGALREVGASGTALAGLLVPPSEWEGVINRSAPASWLARLLTRLLGSIPTSSPSGGRRPGSSSSGSERRSATSRRATRPSAGTRPS